jgi:hypothetical protein
MDLVRFRRHDLEGDRTGRGLHERTKNSVGLRAEHNLASHFGMQDVCAGYGARKSTMQGSRKGPGARARHSELVGKGRTGWTLAIGP